MAGKNRTSYKSKVGTDYPSGSNITAAQHVTHVQDELSDNIHFRLDTISTQSEASGAITVDFQDYDRVDLTISGTGGSTLTLSNLEDGDSKWLKISKAGTETITFSSVTDFTSDSVWSRRADFQA